VGHGQCGLNAGNRLGECMERHVNHERTLPTQGSKLCLTSKLPNAQQSAHGSLQRHAEPAGQTQNRPCSGLSLRPVWQGRPEMENSGQAWCCPEQVS